MAKPKPSKYSRARIRSKARRPKRGGGSRGWIIATIAIAVVGTLLVVLSYNDRQNEAAVGPIANKDHWHAYLGVNLCGTWAPAVPQFEGRDGSMTPNPQAGIHSHADFLIHDHPYASDESGNKATLGRYLSYAQSHVTADSIKLWSNWVPNTDYTNGDKCKGSGKPGELQWKVGKLGEPWPTKAMTGNPADHKIENGEIIALYFVPKGTALDQPPGSDEALKSINDLGGQPAVTTPSTVPSSVSSTPAGSTSATTAAATSSTTGASTSSTTAAGSTSTSKP
jgi:hypothetical protein